MNSCSSSRFSTGFSSNIAQAWTFAPNRSNKLANSFVNRCSKIAMVMFSRGCAIIPHTFQDRKTLRRYFGHLKANYFVIMPGMHDAAYQGTRGANSEDAAMSLLSSAARLLPRDTLEDV